MHEQLNMLEIKDIHCLPALEEVEALGSYSVLYAFSCKGLGYLVENEQQRPFGMPNLIPVVFLSRM